jgi:hypothetical protein
MDIAGKTIAVVGNARSLLASAHGAAIDAHDVVLRMNRGLAAVPGAQGSRTEILAFATFRGVADIHERFGARWHIWMSPKERDAAPRSQLPPMTEFYDLDRWQALHDHLGSRPSVGAMVLDYLSTKDPRGVTVFGFDFKRSHTFYQQKQHIGPHDYRSEEAFCEELVRASRWNIARDYERP